MTNTCSQPARALGASAWRVASGFLARGLALAAIALASATTTHAACPITQLDKLAVDTPVGGAESGFAVDLDGSLAIVGSPDLGAGQATVYAYRPAEGWAPLATVSDPLGLPGDRFGETVAISGSLFAVGAPGSDRAGFNAGAVFVYRAYLNDAGVWVAKLESIVTSDTPQSGSEFGAALDLAPSILVVGAPDGDGGSPGSGAVFVYRRTANTQAGFDWNEEEKLTDPLGQPGDRFGEAVSVDDSLADYAVVGAPGFNGARGKAVAFLGQVGGPWTSDDLIEALTPSLGDRFGAAVALAGESLLIGAPDTAPGQRGLAHLFDATPGALSLYDWVLNQQLASPAPQAGDRLGASVALSPELAVVGAPGGDGLVADSGLVLAFPLSGGNVDPPAEVLADDGVATAQLGASVGASSLTIITGSPAATVGPVNDAGAAYVFAAACPRDCPVDPTTCFFWQNPGGGDLGFPSNWDNGATPGVGETGIFDDNAGPVPLGPLLDVFLVNPFAADRLIFRTDEVQLDLRQAFADLLAQPADGIPGSLIVDGYPGQPNSLTVFSSQAGLAQLNATSATIAESALAESSLEVLGPLDARFEGAFSLARQGFGSLTLDSAAFVEIASTFQPGAVFGLDIAAGPGAGSVVVRGDSVLAAGAQNNPLPQILLASADPQQVRGEASLVVEGSGSELRTLADSIRLADGGLASISLLNGSQWTSSSITPVVAGAGIGAALTISLGPASSWSHSLSGIQLGDGNARTTALLSANAQLDAPAIQIGDGSAIRGEGQVIADVVNNGSVDPARLAGGAVTGTGTLDITGGYSQAPGPDSVDTGDLHLRIDSETAGDQDRLDVGGDATLDGGLIVSFNDGYQPATPGDLDQLTLLSALTVNGEFDATLLPRLDTQNSFYLEYQASAVTLRLAGLPARGVQFDAPISGDTGLPAGIVRDVALADIDGDGLDDAVVALADAGAPLVNDGFIAILYAETGANGGFSGFRTPAQRIGANVGVNPSSVEVADLDQNGRPDIIVANQGAPTDEANDSVSFILNGSQQGDDFQISQLGQSIVGDQPTDLAIGDFDGAPVDPYPDVAVVNHGSDTVSFLINQGVMVSFVTGGPTWDDMSPPCDEELPDESDPLGIQPGDYDGNSATDVGVTSNGCNGVFIILNDGAEGYEAQPPIEVGEEPTEIETGDVDGDGSQTLALSTGACLDIITVNERGGTISILLNRSTPGQLSFEPRVDLPVASAMGSMPDSIAIGDYDGDGDVDLAIVGDGDNGQGMASRAVLVLRNDSVLGQLNFASSDVFQTQPSTPLVPTVVRTGDLNGDGQDDLATGNIDDAANQLALGSGDVTAFISAPACQGDVDGDGDTDVFDFSELAANFGSMVPPWSMGDLDGDGDVDVFDFAELAAGFGCDVNGPPPAD